MPHRELPDIHRSTSDIRAMQQWAETAASIRSRYISEQPVVKWVKGKLTVGGITTPDLKQPTPSEPVVTEAILNARALEWYRHTHLAHN